MISRRSFLEATGLIGLVATRGGAEAPPHASRPPGQLPPLDRPDGPSDRVAKDEAYWGRVAAYYQVSDRYTNLEAGYFGMMAAPVLAAYHRAIDRVNLESSYFARRSYDGELAVARGRLADFLGATPAEVLFTRGATEALQRLIVQYRGVSRGDVVMYADLDYNAMQFAMNALARQRGARVARLVIPEPASREAVLAAYAEALDREPRTRLLLLTHLNNKTGLIIPVKEIVTLARERGADVIVDAAHSFGQVDLRLEDLGADFVGLNLHKWIGAPVGVGAMYIRDGRLDDIDIMLEDESADPSRIDSRIHTGTANFATFLTVPDALDFHAAVGPAHKAARVRYLRDRWVGAARAQRGIDLLTPDDRDMVAAITSFRLNGRTGRAENQGVVASLLERYGLFTVWRTGLAHGDCVRVTPALYNVPAHADRLVAALAELASA